MNSIKTFKKMNKFATKNRAVLNVAMFILTIAALSILSKVPGLSTSPLSSIVGGAVTAVIMVILFRVMVKVATKK